MRALVVRGDLERAFRDTATAAEADRATAKAAGRTFNGHRYSRRWTTAGQSAQLLSLDGRLRASTGGPASTSVDGLLWDRRARARVPVARSLDRRLVISADAIGRLAGADGYPVEDLGARMLRGRAGPIQVYAVRSPH